MIEDDAIHEEDSLFRGVREKSRNVNRWILWISYFHDDLYRGNDFLRPTPRAIHRAVEGSNWDWPKARRIRALPDTRTRVCSPFQGGHQRGQRDNRIV